jgi:Protein of unknown function (DUF2510)
MALMWSVWSPDPQWVKYRICVRVHRKRARRTNLCAMYEYSSVNASAYDVDSLVAKLNGRSAEGWDVVSVLSSGGDIVAILKREGTGVSASAAAVAAEPVVEAAPAPSYDYAAAAPAAAVVEAAPAPVVEAVAPAPVYEAVVPEPAAPVSEPVGWGASAAETVTSSFDSGTAAVAAAAVAVPAVAAVAAAPAAAAPAAVVTTPAGWYPDPSGRFEMRYWDGTAWSEHVSRQGQQYTDPPVA